VTVAKERSRPDDESPEDEGIPEMEGPPDRQRETSDSPAGMVIPRDRAAAAEDHGTTAEEQREGEPLEGRLAEEEPNRGSATHREQAGRLAEDDPAGRDSEKDLVGDEAEDDTEGLTAEEAAVRVVDSAPGATNHPDDYVAEP
jgi:hypothetical protein